MDAEGYLNTSGRKTDMIISGGFNIYPAELERVLGSHEGVELVAVVGAPHPEWGETPVAVVVPRGAADTARLEAELRELCRSQLGGVKAPPGAAVPPRLPPRPAGQRAQPRVQGDPP